MTEQYIDTHTHIYDQAFEKDFESVVQRAEKAGVHRMILPSIDKESFPGMMSTARKLGSKAYTAAGLHPTSVKEDWGEELGFALKEISTGNHIAIGEIGIDTYWSADYLEQQITVFEEQLKLASKYNLPVIIHSRDATEPILQVLERNKNLSLKGVFHAYSGSTETLDIISGYGDFYIGIGGVVTFKNSKLKSVVSRTDISKIVLETDSPWLTPHPYRGKRNEPSYLTLIATEIASLKGTVVTDIAAVTTKNAETLFAI